ncbi:MAG: preprotein translocase subunit SecE [Sedimentisphaerales bacterium]|nr:preprotein translocase subunit SecE [Sedimentisphaerales bacterium]
MALKFYKKGQGYYTRLGTAAGLGILSIYGCYALYNKLAVLLDDDYLGPVKGVWTQALVPVVLLAIFAWFIFKIVNTPKYADFMIATEGEMKKVSWSSKKEIVSSTKVVIITVAIVAVLLAVVDHAFAWFFNWIGVLQVI